MLESSAKFQSFDCKEAPASSDEPNDVDKARRLKRRQSLDDCAPYEPPLFLCFDCKPIDDGESSESGANAN